MANAGAKKITVFSVVMGYGYTHAFIRYRRRFVNFWCTQVIWRLCLVTSVAPIVARAFSWSLFTIQFALTHAMAKTTEWATIDKYLIPKRPKIESRTHELSLLHALPVLLQTSKARKHIKIMLAPLIVGTRSKTTRYVGAVSPSEIRFCATTRFVTYRLSVGNHKFGFATDRRRQQR